MLEVPAMVVAPVLPQHAPRPARAAWGVAVSDIIYHPRSLAQVITFRAGKALGKAAGSKGHGDNN